MKSWQVSIEDHLNIFTTSLITNVYNKHRTLTALCQANNWNKDNLFTKTSLRSEVDFVAMQRCAHVLWMNTFLAQIRSPSKQGKFILILLLTIFISVNELWMGSAAYQRLHILVLLLLYSTVITDHYRIWRVIVHFLFSCKVANAFRFT